MLESETEIGHSVSTACANVTEKMAAAAASATVKSVAGLVQYVVCRRDLLKEKKWNLGAFVAQVSTIL